MDEEGMVEPYLERLIGKQVTISFNEDENGGYTDEMTGTIVYAYIHNDFNEMWVVVEPEGDGWFIDGPITACRIGDPDEDDDDEDDGDDGDRAPMVPDSLPEEVG
jgi:hypothetical protein